MPKSTPQKVDLPKFLSLAQNSKVLQGLSPEEMYYLSTSLSDPTKLWSVYQILLEEQKEMGKIDALYGKIMNSIVDSLRLNLKKLDNKQSETKIKERKQNQADLQTIENNLNNNFSS